MKSGRWLGRLIGFWILSVLLAGLSSCSSCGGGQEETPPPKTCPPYQTLVGNRCVVVDGEGFEFGDRPDNEGQDGLVDGDGSDDGGETGDQDGDADGDGIADGDQGEDQEFGGEEGEYEFELEPPTEWAEVEKQSGTCTTEFDCPEGFYCGVDFLCHPDEEDAADGEEIELCENGLPGCSNHKECGLRRLCDIGGSNCCQDVFSYCLSCSDNGQCPTTAEASNGWYCRESCCFFDCYTDNWCQEKPGGGNLFCSSHGQCVPFGTCTGGDCDAEEEAGACQSCADCQARFGSGYYCNSKTGLCTPYGAGGCCQDSDCVSVQFPDSTCILESGVCNFYKRTDKGRIGGMLHIVTALGSLQFRAVLKNMAGEVLAANEPLVPQADGGAYSVGYSFAKLQEGSYQVFVNPIGYPANTVAYPFNPVLINYSDASHTLRDNIDFYLGLPDPRLGRMSGTVALADPYGDASVTVQLKRMRRAGGLEDYLSAEASPSTGTARAFTLTDVEDGYYLLEAFFTYQGVVMQDFWSQPLHIQNHEDQTGQSFPDISFHFGDVAAGLGKVAGAVQLGGGFRPNLVRMSLEVYNFDYKHSYSAATLDFSDPAPGAALNYQFINVESGPGGAALSYAIRCEALDGPFTFEARPLNSEVSVTANTDETGRDLFFNDQPAATYATFSGAITFPAALPAAAFSIEVYLDAARTLLVRRDPVLDLDTINHIAPLFVEGLDTGTYYPEAAAYDINGLWLDSKAHDPIDVSWQIGPKDLTGVDFDFNP